MNYSDAYKKDDIDIVIELIGGSEGPAKKLVFNSIKNGKHVITANKALISTLDVISLTWVASSSGASTL